LTQQTFSMNSQRSIEELRAMIMVLSDGHAHVDQYTRSNSPYTWGVTTTDPNIYWGHWNQLREWENKNGRLDWLYETEREALEVFVGWMKQYDPFGKVNKSLT
jgi:hypothetical protein